jgi:NADH dehydrogenase
MLPDIVGRGVFPATLLYSLPAFCEKTGCDFIKAEVIGIDRRARVITTADKTIQYDLLLIASGTQTNFYGNTALARAAWALDTVVGARDLREAFLKNDYETVLVAGGGYTGIEIATHLARLSRALGKKTAITIVEKAPVILGALPDWMRAYVSDNLARLGIRVLTNVSVERAEGGKVFLSNDEAHEQAMLVWVAGVCTADFVSGLVPEKTPQGRVTVDEFLRVTDDCFLAGDAAGVRTPAGILRMAVQFAIAQGRCAADNIVRTIVGKPLRAYKPFDRGYVIPMGNGSSCGNVFGVKVQGIVSTLLHYALCAYFMPGLRNKARIVIGCFSRGGAA